MVFNRNGIVTKRGIPSKDFDHVRLLYVRANQQNVLVIVIDFNLHCLISYLPVSMNLSSSESYLPYNPSGE